MECLSYKGGCGVCESSQSTHIKTFKKRAALGYKYMVLAY